MARNPSVGEVWTNWAGEQRCAPRAIARPNNEAELAEIVARATAQRLTLRAVGSGHSFTDCACTDGVMIDMTGMQRVLAVDHATGRATVEGGITLQALGPLLAERGLALENQGDIDRQTITGAISTATHGTGMRLPNISARVVGLRLVTAGGDVLDLTADSDREAYLAARVSIGALGVISTVTIQCVPLYTLHRHDEPLSLADTLSRLDEHIDGNDHFEFLVFPYAETALTRRTRRSTDEPAPTAPWKRYVQEEIVENRLLGAVCRIGRRFPSMAPRLNRLVSSAMSTSDVEDHAHKVYATTRAVRFTEMEYAIPREHARGAVERVLRLIGDRRLPILFPLEVRFAAADEAFLSTAFQRDTCYVAVHQFAGMEFETFFRAVETIMDGYDGRPHWGKRHYQNAATLRHRYPDWDRFQAVRARLDPVGSFANDYTRRVLGSLER
jgi:L-gulono-1,4-lactone dehydrogenase